MSLIRVSSKSETRLVAGAIAGMIRDEHVAEIQAIGAAAVNQMVKAIIAARRYLRDEGIATTCDPSFVEMSIDDVERTGIRFTHVVISDGTQADHMQ